MRFPIILNLLIALLLVRLTGCNSAQENSAVNEPTDRDVYLGEVFPVGQIVHTFRVLNSTSKDILVTDVKASCMCHVVDRIVGKTIPKSSFLDFPVALPGIGREESATVVVVTDSDVPKFSQIILTLRAKYLEAVWSDPAELDIRSVEAVIFSVHSRSGVTLKPPRSLFSTRKFVNVDVVSVTPECIICSAKIDSDLVPLGISNDYVTFIFEGEQVRRLDVKAKITRDFN